MIRLNVFIRDQYPQNGKALVVNKDMSDESLVSLKKKIMDKFNVKNQSNPETMKLFTVNGGQLENINELFMDDVVLVQFDICNEDEHFTPSPSFPLFIKQSTTHNQQNTATLKNNSTKNHSKSKSMYCSIFETRKSNPNQNTKKTIVELLDSNENEEDQQLLISKLDNVIKQKLQLSSNIINTNNSENISNKMKKQKVSNKFGYDFDLLYVFEGKELSLDDPIPDACILDNSGNNMDEAQSTLWLQTSSLTNNKKQLFVIVRTVDVKVIVVTPSGRSIPIDKVSACETIDFIKNKVFEHTKHPVPQQILYYTNDDEEVSPIDNSKTINELENYEGKNKDILLKLKLKTQLYN